MLFKSKYLAKFIEGLSPAIREYSENMAKGALLIRGVIESRFYERSVLECINTVKSNLRYADFHQRVQDFHSEGYLHCVSQKKRLDQLSTHCFDYYFSRLPILLRTKIIARHGKKIRMSANEIKEVDQACFAEWKSHYRDVMQEHKPSGDFQVSLSLTRWYVTRARRDAHIYNSSWFLSAFERLYFQGIADSNINIVTEHAFKSCFPMFWDSFQEQFVVSMSYYQFSGWFKGDLDIDELEAKMVAEEPGRNQQPESK